MQAEEVARPRILAAHWPAGAAEPPPSAARAIDEAAGILAGGGLVAIPTETVYGLAGLALDPAVVSRIFAAKGRPARNPLIVHVADTVAARRLAASWPDSANTIAARFWPGPVTIVVPRRDEVPAIVTAGGPTVAIRCPAHPVARRLLEVLGRPLAAPSANRSMGVSPTTAAHVAASLGTAIDAILDAGPCDRGIESTVIDCSCSPPRILRPGPVGRDAIEEALGGPVAAAGGEPSPVLRSPGLTGRHYAPRATLELDDAPAARALDWLARGLRVGIIALPTADLASLAAAKNAVLIRLPGDPAGYARDLYAAIHSLDDAGVDAIVVESPPTGEPWNAIRDRLSRAAIRGE